MELTQKEADRLLQLEKHQSDSKMYQFPARGGKCQVPLTAGKGKGKENFLLDIYRGRRISIKMTYQTRARKIVPLARVDFNGAKHCNPDGTEVPTPHLHVYREGYGDRWAYPLSPQNFSAPDDPRQSFTEFLQFCNIDASFRIGEDLHHD